MVVLHDRSYLDKIYSKEDRVMNDPKQVERDSSKHSKLKVTIIIVL